MLAGSAAAHSFGTPYNLPVPFWMYAYGATATTGSFRPKSGTLWTTCQDNGVLVLKFTNGAWPLPGSQASPGQQN